MTVAFKNPSFSSYAGENFAPLKPLQDAKTTVQKGGQDSMNGFFREIFLEIKDAEKEIWREKLEVAKVIGNLVSGKLIQKRDLSGDGFMWLKPLKTNRNQDRHNYPVYPQIFEDLKAKWIRVKPTMRARIFGDGYKTEIQAHELNRVIESHFKDIFTPEYELNEVLSALEFGSYATRFYYDERLNQIKQLIPVIKNQPKTLMEGYGGCLACDFEGSPQDFQTDAPMPQCPKCGSFKTTKMLEPTIVDEAQVVGVEEIVQGDITGTLLNYGGLKFDCRQLVHNSSYQLYEQFVPLRLAQEMFGNIDIEADSGGDNIGLRIMESLATRGGSIEGFGVNRTSYAPYNARRAVMSEMWLTPEWYAGFKLDKPVKTVAGEIPANVDFAEIFPESLCVVGFNEMKLITGVFAEKPHIVGGVYFIQSFSGLGKPLSDGVDFARDLNEIHSMAMAGLKRYGASGVFHDKNIPQSAIRKMFDPRQATPIDISGTDDIRKRIGQIQFAPVNPVLPQYSLQLSNLLNLVSLSGDFSEGTLQSVDINTLGGQQLATAKEEGKKGAIISMKVNHRQLSAEAIHQLFRKHIKIPRYYGSGNDRFSNTKGRWIAGMEMPENVKFDAVADSEIPQNEFQKKENAKLMFEKAGGIGNVAMAIKQFPDVASWYASNFGVDIPMLNQEEVWITCLSRLDSIKELSQFYADPNEILAQLEKPLFVDEDAHTLKANFLAQILDDDEVATWNPVARAAVVMLINAHRDMNAQAIGQEQMRQQNIQLGLQANAMMAQQRLQQPMMAQEQQAQNRQSQQDLANEAMSRIADDAQKEADFEREKELAEINKKEK